MAWGRYRRYSRYRRRYRRGFKRMFRRYSRRFVNGSSKSSIRIKVPCTTTESATITSGNNTTTTYVISPFRGNGQAKTTSGATTAMSNIGATSSALYQAYCNLYDQVKCIGCKVRLSITSPIGGTAIPSLQIAHAWDREYTYYDMNTIPTFDELQTGSSGMLSTALNNSIAKLQRSCYASDLMEKATWHDCTLAAGTPPYDEAWDQNHNPSFFVPAFMFAFRTPTSTQAATIAFTADVTWYFSFRNPKYGGSSSNAKLDTETLATKTIPTMGGTDDVDMEAIAADLDLEDRMPVTAIEDPVGSAKRQKARQMLARNKAALERRDPKNA